ncbi:MAG: cysteine desulfurase NifS [Lachnospiraceae bacterium]
MENVIYLDNAATTQLHPEVFKAMEPYFLESYGNPSSIYKFAQTAKSAIEDARSDLAGIINARPEEIYFTGGGSESDNWAIKMIMDNYAAKGNHFITTKIEHHAVLHTAEYLEKKGYAVTYLDVDENGLVTAEQVEAAIRPDTVLISIMTANNEIGTIEPIKEIGAVARKHNVLFHTDAVQAFAHIALDVVDMNIDLLSASAHKIHGPKGIGFLYVRKGVKIGTLIHGGAQERGRRAGTHNVPGIVGMAAAAVRLNQRMSEDTERLTQLRDYAIHRIETEIPYSLLNGDRVKRLPNNIHFCFRFIEGESMLILLDNTGICGSSGSACTSGSLDPSHVLLAIGRPHEIAHGSLRISMSEFTTKAEIDTMVDELKIIIERLRGMSPLYEDFLKKEREAAHV